jgi:hypothetical protein
VLPALLTDPKIRVRTVDERRMMFQVSDNSVIGQHAGESRSSKALNITFWILQGLLAATFLVAGTTKLASPQMQVAFFEKIGLGQWFRYFTGGRK